MFIDNKNPIVSYVDLLRPKPSMWPFRLLQGQKLKIKSKGLNKTNDTTLEN